MAILPDFDPTAFTPGTEIDNTYLRFLAGTVRSYGATFTDPETGEEESERNDEFVTFDTTAVAGVEAAIVRDTAFDGDTMVEDTVDWYAQDGEDNVWYLGEFVINYEYDDDGNFIGTNFDGSWEAGADGASPGWLMRAEPGFGAAYYQEFRPGEAEDEAILVGVNNTVDIDLGTFTNAITTLETTALQPDVAEFKSYAPGVGLVQVEEGIRADGTAELTVELQNLTQLAPRELPDLSALAPQGTGTEKWVTFLTEDAEANGAVGAYIFDTATGDILEGRILFNDTEDLRSGTSASITVEEGQALGLFLVPDADETGLELDDYTDGGLFFTNLQTLAPAKVTDGLAPVVRDADGNFLPIRALHAAGQAGEANFLNPVAGVQAEAVELGVDGVAVFGFEDDIASIRAIEGEDEADRGFFDDALLAVSDAPLSTADVATLVENSGISRIVGSDDNDRLQGSGEDDQLIGLDGDDRLSGRVGDDRIEGGDGNDTIRGGRGDDDLSGEDGDDHLRGGQGEDEIAGGEGDDDLSGGAGNDALEGDEGNDDLYGGRGEDDLRGGEGNDALYGGRDADRLAGGVGDDLLTGGLGADTFVFNLTDVGTDTIADFGRGDDVIEIGTFLGVTSFEELQFQQVGIDAVFALGDGDVILSDVDASQLGVDDFAFI
ncbi:MAG: calcium-binding protein [Hyphomicrobiales bacterium]